MKFLCVCGYTFVDQTDSLPFKARCIPDQSEIGVFAEIERLLAAAPIEDDQEGDASTLAIVMPKGWRHLYQCPTCGRIYIADGATFHGFEPMSTDTPKTLLEAT